MKKILATIFILSFFVTYSYSQAQIQSQIDGITISSTPDAPAQGEKVTVSIESYTTDLDSASIVWMVNGKSVDRGIGLKDFSIVAPKTGTTLTISAIIKDSGGREIKKTLVIRSGSVEIIWESKGYTPAFFKGKIPFSFQNNVHFVAIPHLSSNTANEANPKDLIYKWKLGGKYIDGGSGQGKQSVDIKADEIPKILEVSVEVYTRDQKESASNSINISPTTPSIELYEMNPLYGILTNKALVDSVTLDKAEIGIFAAPFGFNYNPKINNLEYIWSINNVDQPSLLKNQNIILKTTGNVDGSSNIKLNIRNPSDVIQGADSSLIISFKKLLSKGSSAK
jgi:hypothetical protein